MKLTRFPALLVWISISAPGMVLADVRSDCQTGAGAPAIDACTSLLTSDPGNAAEWYSGRARARMEMGDGQAALEDLKRAIGLDPVSGAAYGIRARVYLELGDLEAAQQDAGFAVMLAPDDPASHVIQGRVLAAVGAADAARQSFEQAAELAPDDVARQQIKSAVAEALGSPSAPITADVSDEQGALPPSSDQSAAREAPAVQPTADPPGGTRAADSAPGASAEELAFWDAVKDSPHPEELQAYVDAFPQGVFTGLAQVRLQRLRRKAETPAVSAPPVQSDPETSPLVALCDAAVAHPANTDNPAGLEPIQLDQIDAPDAIAKCSAALESFPKHDRTAYHLGRAYHALGDVDQTERLYKQAATSEYIRALTGLGILYRDEAGLGAPPSRAIGYFERAGELGDRTAQLQAAWAYYRGTGVKQDYVASARWFRAAAEQGSDEAQTELGWHYENGLGVAKDIDQAVYFYSLAAEQGNRVAQNNLGWFYQKGQGVPQSHVEAVFWYRKAAEQGLARAQTNLGLMYELGRGVSPDKREAVRLYRLAAEQGLANAQTNLGWMYETGSGAEKDYREAVRWYRKAADQGFARAQTNLGWMYESGRGVDQDLGEAVRWYRMGADQGYANAQTNLGWMYESGLGVTQDDAKAVELYRAAAKQDFPRAQVNLAWMTEHGRGVPEDLGVAFNWYKLAANLQNARAQTELGRMYLFGKGVDKDVDESLVWLRRSASQDYGEAYTFLGFLFETEQSHYSASQAAYNYHRALIAGQDWPATRTGSYWDRETARALQKLLRQSGHYTGQLDGVVGRGTIQAMKALCDCD